MKWKPTAEQEKQFTEQGYFVIPNVISHELACELRGIIKNTVLLPEPDVDKDNDPMDPMGDTPESNTARFRKLNRFCSKAPLIWFNVHCGEMMVEVGRYFLGNDIFLKFDSCFLKPAKTGSATPWHQDNGLWRDGETGPFNFWMALDPSKQYNGCLQFIPGSHNGEIITHVLYEGSIHGELPRERVKEMIELHGVHHIELEPGDVVCWNSNLWHYSPPNLSEHSRIAIAGVYSNPKITTTRFWDDYLWVMKDGKRCKQFPQEVYSVERSPSQPEYPSYESINKTNK